MQLLYAMVEGAVPFAVSPALISEHRRVLERPPLQRRHRLDAGELERLLRAIEAHAILVNPPALDPEGPDPGDQHLWELLRAVPHAVLVTGDQALIAHAPSWARVMSPREAMLPV